MSKINDDSELQLISIRLPKELISELKIIGQLYNIGYQPLVRNVLVEYTKLEFKKITTEYLQFKTRKSAKSK